MLGDTQFLRGYSLLLAYPMVEKLNDLQGPVRTQFLEDMARLGDAVIAATGAVRANYSIYGNLDPFLHAHVWPRFAEEDPRFRTLPPFSYPEEIRRDERHRADPERHRETILRLRRALVDGVRADGVRA